MGTHKGVFVMEFIYAVKTDDELKRYREYAAAIHDVFNDYIDFLKKEYSVLELPKSIVLTDMDIATKLTNDIPVPAYTNEHRTMFCPDIEVWRKIYLSQLDSYRSMPELGKAVDEISAYYENELSQKNILAILGHELAHHSELFLDDFSSDRSDGVWFEEGMVEYISHRYFLNEKEFAAQRHINKMLIQLYKAKYGCASIESFGSSTYTEDFSGIFFEYWRSFEAVASVIDAFGSDIGAVFKSYAEWGEDSCGKSLSEWFNIPDECCSPASL